MVSSKNRMTAPLHLVEEQVQPRKTRLEVAQHSLMEQRELPVDVLQRLDVLGEELEPLERGLLVLARRDAARR